MNDPSPQECCALIFNYWAGQILDVRTILTVRSGFPQACAMTSLFPEEGSMMPVNGLLENLWKWAHFQHVMCQVIVTSVTAFQSKLKKQVSR